MDSFTAIDFSKLSYSMIVLSSRDHKGLGVPHEKHHPKTNLTFPDNDETVLVR